MKGEGVLSNSIDGSLAHRFIVLDSWRGIAAIFVAFGHLKTSGSLSMLSISSTSYRFVDFFFVLSGFVISYSSSQILMRDYSSLLHFFVRRIARLWPLHIFILSLFLLHQIVLFGGNRIGLVSDPVAFSEGFASKYILHNIFLVQAWGVLSEPTWNKPAWSISTEFFAYIVFGLSCFFLKRNIWKVIPAIVFYFFYYVVANPEVMWATYSGALIRCLAGFSIGMLAYRCYMHSIRMALPIFTGCAASFFEVSCVTASFIGIVWLPKDMGGLILPIFALTIFIFSTEKGIVSSFLKKRLFVYLGGLSYSIYLVHAFIALALYSLAATLGCLGKLSDGRTGVLLVGGAADFLIIAYLFFVVLVSSFTYRFIEIPGQSFGKAILARGVGPAKRS